MIPLICPIMTASVQKRKKSLLAQQSSISHHFRSTAPPLLAACVTSGKPISQLQTHSFSAHDRSEPATGTTLRYGEIRWINAFRVET